MISSENIGRNWEQHRKLRRERERNRVGKFLKLTPACVHESKAENNGSEFIVAAYMLVVAVCSRTHVIESRKRTKSYTISIFFFFRIEFQRLHRHKRFNKRTRTHTHATSRITEEAQNNIQKNQEEKKKNMRGYCCSITMNRLSRHIPTDIYTDIYRCAAPLHRNHIFFSPARCLPVPFRIFFFCLRNPSFFCCVEIIYFFFCSLHTFIFHILFSFRLISKEMRMLSVPMILYYSFIYIY